MRAKVKMPTDAEDAAINAGIAADPDTFEVTPEIFAQMRPAAEVMPSAVLEELTARRGRGPGKTPAKVLVSLRVEPDLLARLRASGPGWQVRAVEALKRLAKP